MLEKNSPHSRHSKLFHAITSRLSISIFVALLSCANTWAEEQLSTCSITAKVDYTPALVDGFYWIAMTGTAFEKIEEDFCRDRVGKQTRIRVPEYLFSKSARPKLDGEITVIESRETIAVGDGFVEIRYFTETP